MLTSLQFLFVLLSIVGYPLITFGQELRIDHVISLNSDLGESSAEFTNKGFSIKQGRLHENGLLNAHIKFQNYSSFELMSLVKESEDAIATEYASLMRKGVKGAYLALTGLTRNRIESVLKKLNFQYHVDTSKLWTYISFPSNSEFAHVFFIVYHVDQNISENYTTHPNGFDKIQNVIIDGSQNLITLLEEFELVSDNMTQDVVRFKTKTGDVTIRPLRPQKNERPRIIGIIFGKTSSEDTLHIELN